MQRRRRGESASRTTPSIVEAIRQLALVCDDKDVAAYLNRNQLLTARGNRWCRMAVTSLRNKRGIAVHSEERQLADGWLNLTNAAARCGTTGKTLRRLVDSGDIKAMHPLDDGPWVFNTRDLDDPAFRQRLERRLGADLHPAGPNPRQLTLTNSGTYQGEAL